MLAAKVTCILVPFALFYGRNRNLTEEPMPAFDAQLGGYIFIDRGVAQHGRVTLEAEEA